MLPRIEMDALLTTITDSAAQAERGDVAGEYEALLAGLRRAEELRDAGGPWGEELVRRW